MDTCLHFIDIFDPFPLKPRITVYTPTTKENVVHPALENGAS